MGEGEQQPGGLIQRTYGITTLAASRREFKNRHHDDDQAGLGQEQDRLDRSGLAERERGEAQTNGEHEDHRDAGLSAAEHPLEPVMQMILADIG